MVLSAAREPLELRELPVPKAGPGQVLLRVRACGLCRTDLHVVDGELAGPKLPAASVSTSARATGSE